jgi:signal peptidase I
MTTSRRNPTGRVSVTPLDGEHHVTDESRSGIARVWSDWLRSALLIVLAITALRSAVADWNDVPTGSMKPTIIEGDRIVVNKLAYDLKFPYTRWRLATWDDPARGDIVVLLSPSDGTRLVKRVIGLPGDEIAMDQNRLVVNDQPIQYRALDLDRETSIIPAGATEGRILELEELAPSSHQVMVSPHPRSCSSFATVHVPMNHYFVLGDNRDESLDSRYFGLVDRRLILGRAVAVAASVDPGRHFLPRWRRFFQALR